MKTNHLEQKRKILLDRREQLIGRFNEAARKRKSTARLCTVSVRPTQVGTRTFRRIQRDTRFFAGWLI